MIVLSPEKFLSDSYYKNGVYIFTTDSCQFCADYKRSLEVLEEEKQIYLVECTLESQKTKIHEALDRVGFPITVGYCDNERKFTKLGKLADIDLNPVLEFLHDVPKISEEEGKLRAAAPAKIRIAVHLFPVNADEDYRKSMLQNWKEEGVISIDGDGFYGFTGDPLLDSEALYRVLDVLVMHNIFSPDGYSPMGERLVSRVGESIKLTDKVIRYA